MIKHIFLIFTAFCMFFLSGGCAGFWKKSLKIQEEHLALLDQKIQELEKVLSSLNSSSENLGKRVEELSQKTADMDTNYSKLYSHLDELSSNLEVKDNAFETILSESQRNIDNLEKKLSEIEKAKTDLQNQIKVLQEKRSGARDSNIEQPNSALKEKAGETTEQEMITDAPHGSGLEGGKKIEGLATIQGKEALQKLLDEALAFYRNENYREAISKWQEVLAIDPENLEAKFNIEIATKKLKSLPEK